MTIARITDHVARRLARLTTFYKNSSSHRGVLSAFAQQCQAIEDAAFGLLVMRSINDAAGIQLDEIGKILKVEREGRDDAGLRLRLRAQVLANSRSGELNTLLVILRMLAPTEAALRLDELYPAALVARIDSSSTPDGPAIAAVLRLAKAAGVSVQLVYQNTADDGALFTLTDTTQTGAGLGLGDTNDATTGGQLAGVS